MIWKNLIEYILYLGTAAELWGSLLYYVFWNGPHELVVAYLYFQKLKVYGSFWINKWNKVSFDENVVIKETTVG